MRAGIAAALALALGAGAGAAQVTGDAAAAALFPPEGAQIVLAEGVRLSRADRRTLEQVVVAVTYYGAIAFAPDLGLLSPATVVAQNYHDTPPAEAAALADCASKSGGARCAIAARVLPAGHGARPVQMSAAATEAFRAEYLPARAPRAFALSAQTGSWGFAQGQGAAARALAACRERAADRPAADCAVAVAD